MSRSRRFGLTLIELLVFIACTAAAVFAARWAGYRDWRVAAAGIIGFLMPLAVLFLIALLLDLIWTGRPAVPPCRSGKCSTPDDYSVQLLEDGNYGLLCKCGRRYKRRGPKFLEIQPDGSLRPYLRWRAFRRWEPDTDA
jgi:hypothetical protein